MKLFVLALSLALLAGCSEKTVVGAYQKVQAPDKVLTLSGDGTFVMNSGDTGTYIVKSKTVVLNDPAFGEAVGVVDGNIITFPASSSSATAGNAAGTWKQISITP
jgi:hypothetical protein